MTRQQAIEFLEDAARYFENRSGEDVDHWSNAHNAENCRKIAAMIAHGELTIPKEE